MRIWDIAYILSLQRGSEVHHRLVYVSGEMSKKSTKSAAVKFSNKQQQSSGRSQGGFYFYAEFWHYYFMFYQGDYDWRGQQTASPMLTAIMSGGVGISGRELSKQLINSLEQANHSFS